MSDRLWVATRKGVFEVQRSSSGWQVHRVHFLGQNASMLLRDPRDGALYVALDHGHFGAKLQRSLDGGDTWAEIPAPAYPPQPPGEDWKTYDGKPIPWSLKMIWELVPGGRDEPGTLWCGTLPGGLFRSRDRGETWALTESLWHHPKRAKWMGGGADLPGLHSIAVNPKDSRHVTLAISSGGVWITRDGGETWTNEGKGMRSDYSPPEQAYDMTGQDPHRLVQSPTDPDVLWVQHHNGIFRSTDAGETWVEITGVDPSVFGFAVAVHPADPETAWFVPAAKDMDRIPLGGQVVVTRTRDGGRTFTALRQGLPQTHAYDLVYRHALDVDARGERLAFGSTTGSLWVSEDQGDSWRTVSEHLPPVYCVRFEKA